MTIRRMRVAFPVPERRLSRWIDDARQDLRQAMRQHARSPAFAALVVATLAVGIGANATMAGVIDGLLFRAPPHVRDASRVVRLVFAGRLPSGARFGQPYGPYPDLFDVEQEASAFSEVAGFARASLSLGSGRDAVAVSASLVSSRFFHLLGVRATLGRLFGPEDGLPTDASEGGPPLAVLAHGFWIRQFGRDSGVIGRTIHVGHLAYVVAGIAPRGFRGVESAAPDVWLPISVAAPVELPRGWYAGRGATWVALVGRLRPGATPTEAGRQATEISRRHATGTMDETRVVAAPVIRGRGPDAPREVRVALWLGGVSLLVLLIACANVANLLLGRAFARRREVAVRIALGAGAPRLLRHLLAEALLLFGMGAAFALLLALAGQRLLHPLFATDLASAGVIDWPVLAFTGLVALASGAVISLAPMLQARSLDLTRALRTGATGGGGRSARLRTSLLFTQAALCMLLLVGAGLFALSLRRVERVDLGMDPARTLQVRLTLDRSLVPVRDEYEATVDEMIRRVRAVPGVTGVAQEVGGQAVSASSRRTRGRRWWSITDRAAYLMAVDSGYFTTLGATSLIGRDFLPTDRAGSPRVAIITRSLAELLWPGESAPWQCLEYELYGDDRAGCVTVVGVIGGAYSSDILDRGKLLLYIPMAQRATTIQRPSVMYVGLRGSPARAVPAIRRAIQGVRPDLPAVTVTPMRDVLEPQVRPWRLARVMFALFGLIALVIAAVGLYGVVAFSAAQRSHEIAVRIALGARTRHVLRTVAGGGLVAVVAGLATGAGIALAVRRWIGALLFEVAPDDPRVIGGMAAVLLIVAIAASLVPVARSMRRNPAGVLRAD